MMLIHQEFDTIVFHDVLHANNICEHCHQHAKKSLNFIFREHWSRTLNFHL